jgi:hypothetical protein
MMSRCVPLVVGRTAQRRWKLESHYKTADRVRARGYVETSNVLDSEIYKPLPLSRPTRFHSGSLVYSVNGVLLQLDHSRMP